MAVGKYERELRGILSGDDESLEGGTKTCSQDERENYFSIKEIPFMVVRAGGSLGIDLLAIRGELSFPIEVKTLQEGVLYFSDEARLTEQADQMQEACSASNLLPLYAYRWKGQRGDKWRMFTMEIDELAKKHRVLKRKVPTLQETTHGNYKMEWEEGMPLHRFIAYLNHLLG